MAPEMPLMYPILGCSDPVSSLSHILGVGIFAVLSIQLLDRSRVNLAYLIGVIIFVFSVIFLLSMSAIYHFLTPGTGARALFQRLDHAAIFILIAGTFTPIQLGMFHGFSRWSILIFVWVAAITGLVLKVIFFNTMPEWVSLVCYLGLGWVGALLGVLIIKRFGFSTLKPLLYGGLAYSLGAILEFFRVPVIAHGVFEAHELFHVLVLIAIGYHWHFIHEHCTPRDFRVQPGHSPVSGQFA